MKPFLFSPDIFRVVKVVVEFLFMPTDFYPQLILSIHHSTMFNLENNIYAFGNILIFKLLLFLGKCVKFRNINSLHSNLQKFSMKFVKLREPETLLTLSLVNIFTSNPCFFSSSLLLFIILVLVLSILYCFVSISILKLCPPMIFSYLFLSSLILIPIFLNSFLSLVLLFQIFRLLLSIIIGYYYWFG